MLVLITLENKKYFYRGTEHADPEDGYGWEKLFMNVCADTLWKIIKYL